MGERQALGAGWQEARCCRCFCCSCCCCCCLPCRRPPLVGGRWCRWCWFPGVLVLAVPASGSSRQQRRGLWLWPLERRVASGAPPGGGGEGCGPPATSHSHSHHQPPATSHQPPAGTRDQGPAGTRGARRRRRAARGAQCGSAAALSTLSSKNSKSNQRLWGCHLPFGVHIAHRPSLITNYILHPWPIWIFFLPPRYPRPPGAPPW
jgi:hypothetical protein